MKIDFKRILRQFLIVVLPIAVALSLSAGAFSKFTKDSREAAENRNKTYIKDFTLDLASKLDEKFANAGVSVAAIASMNAGRLLVDANIPSVLLNIEAATSFDHVRFVDENGFSHTSSGTIKDVSDRTYFTEGIKGISGSTYITDSRLTNQRQIGFYAPMYYGGNIRGVIVAFYDESTLLNSINYEFFGEKASVGIVSRDGKMIVNSPGNDFKSLYERGAGEDICDLRSCGFVDDMNSLKLSRAYRTLSETNFYINLDKNKKAIGYMAPIDAVNLSVYMIYPDGAATSMYENSISVGRTLERTLILISAVLLFYIVMVGLVKFIGWRRVNMALLKTSNTDEMTGLLNRRAYEKECSMLALNIPDNFIYAAFDINGLKSANDRYGHSVGDELITGAAYCLKKCFGQYGKVFRIGGDEFIAIIYADETKLSEIKEKFIEETNNWHGTCIDKLNVSCGYVRRDEFINPDFAEISHTADQRMYEEKALFYKKNGNDRRKS